MANLYEINYEILNCIDEETGEVDIERLTALQQEKSQKIENIALWIKNLLADAEAYKAEKQAFEDRQRRATAKAESLKAYLASALEGQPFSSTRANITFRKSDKVIIDAIDLISAEYVTMGAPVADKVAIKKAIKSGVKLEGCHLEDTQSIIIK